jgi:hypothetical protein
MLARQGKQAAGGQMHHKVCPSCRQGRQSSLRQGGLRQGSRRQGNRRQGSRRQGRVGAQAGRSPARRTGP